MQGLPTDFFEIASTVELRRGEKLFHQHARAEHLFLLLEGQVAFYGFSGGEAILIGQTYSKHTPVGLGFFQSPFRYVADALVDSEQAIFLRINRLDLQNYFSGRPEEEKEFYRFVNTCAQNLIEESSELFLSLSSEGSEIKPHLQLTLKEQSRLEFDQEDATLFLLHSPFFEVFEERYLEKLAQVLQRFQYSTGDVIYEQGGACSGIDILESGEINFSRQNNLKGLDQTVWFRSISTPGYLLGSAGVLNQTSYMTVTASKDSVVYHVPYEAIMKLETEDPRFGLILQKRVTWLLSNQFRTVQTRLFSTAFEEEAIIVTNLIENNQSKLSLRSPLHKVPHLLKDKLTTREGLNILHKVEETGNSNERNLASLGLDNLKQTEKETSFLEALGEIYSSVTNAPAHLDFEELRMRCNEASHKAFSIPSIKLVGYNNLPKEPGNVFIYNHLLNDPFYTLPNQFQITLDAHYLSALISEKYGKTAMRIVRIGMESEYAHEDYYERLGFIDVYTSESRALKDEQKEKAKIREELAKKIETLLSEGTNLVFSPEGTSYPTDQSPGKFKSGIFRMALKMKKEPLFVPIVMGHFDKRIPNNTFLCEIKEPFRLSEVLNKTKDKDLKLFLSEYESTYKNYVADLVKPKMT